MTERFLNTDLLGDFKRSKEMQVLVSAFRYYPVSTDIDGVEVDLNTPAVSYANVTLGTQFRADQITHDYRLTELITENVYGYTHEQALSHAIGCYNTPEVLLGAEPVEGAQEASYFFWQFGIDILRNTSRPSWTLDQTIEWYQNNMFWVNPNLILLPGNSHTINPANKKYQIGLHDIKFHLEDSLPQAVDLARAFPNLLIGLVTQYWNEQLAVPDDVSDRILIPGAGEYPEYPRVVQTYMKLGRHILG